MSSVQAGLTGLRRATGLLSRYHQLPISTAPQGLLHSNHPPRLANTMGSPAHHLPHQLSFAESFSTSTARAESFREEDGDEAGSREAIASAESVLALKEKAGEISAITVEKAVRELCDAYLQLEGQKEKAEFLAALSSRSVDREKVGELVGKYQEKLAGNEAGLGRLEEEMRTALTPEYIWMFKKMGQLEGGVKLLVDLRADLISIIRGTEQTPEMATQLKLMNVQLRQLLSHWFSVGFLDIEQVTWSSPCDMLQKVSDYEAVHPMRNWTDLKSRVGPYRRCFVFTHKSMPGEPIVVLHVALTAEIPGTISSVVRHHRMVKRFSVDNYQGSSRSGREGEDASTCKAAIFYSITSTQTGLQGIELGTHLIKQAVQNLKDELPNLTHFSTLSPIPGFKTWLLSTLQAAQRDDALERVFTQQEMDEMREALSESNQQGLGFPFESLVEAIRNNRWAEDEATIRALEKPLMRLCARYLYHEKHRGHALDPVANFHLRNGAVLWRLNWKGDTSVRGLSNACGMMVNYKYFLDELEANSTAYQEKKSVKASEQVLHLAGNKSKM